MHGTSAGAPVTLSGYGGLISLANPDSVPEGASPRTYDTDFSVGGVGSRAGLTSVYTFSGASVGPSPGGAAVDTSIGGVVWTNPANVLIDDGNYATVNLTGVSGVSSVTVTDGGRYSSSTPPAVVFSGSGSGAAAHAIMTHVISFWTVSSVVVDAPGSYSGAITVTFSGGLPATGTVVQTASHPNSDAIDVTQFGFAVPSTSFPLGFVVDIKAYCTSAATLKVQMLKAGSPVGSVKSLPLHVGGPTTLVYGASDDLFGTAWSYSDLNNISFGLRITATTGGTATVLVGFATITAYLLPSQTNFTFIDTFTAQDATVKNILLDASGNLWIENVTTNPGVLTLAREGITPNSSAVMVNGPDVAYLAFTDGFSGSDMPLQYTPNWIDRITQVGPGAAPAFAPGQATGDTYTISTITQNPAKSDITNAGHLSVLLWSAGPGSTAPGNVLTVYYSPSFYGGTTHPEAEDKTLVNLFNSGVATYVYISGTAFGTGTYLVTSVGNALPPGVDHLRYYFTVQMPTASYQKTVNGIGQYQMTQATLTTTTPIPGLTVGNEITVTGASVATWDTSWQITGALNSAQMAITSTFVTASVATYNYAVISGTPPVAGSLVTVSGTTNANGLLNVVNATIASSTGGPTGSFTLAVPIVTAASAPENGAATTAGTIFTIDPGVLTLGTASNPIYGNSTGGTVTYLAASQPNIIGPGTRQGTVFFITRNGYYTAPAPPVTFTCPENTTSIIATNIPIGPPNVIARGIALTEAGQNGVPGANFFCIPDPVTFVVNNVSYTATSTIIRDNTTTSATFSFNDFVLLNSLAIDVYGYNLFNQIEIGDPGWVSNYDSRNFYGLCKNKVQNFNNLSFDGGFLPAAQLIPLGWSNPDIYGSLLVSPKFGNSYYIQNSSGGTLAVAGLISQTAFLDAYQVPIIQMNTAYSVRVTARIPSGNTTGNLQVDLFDSTTNVTYGVSAIAFGSLNTAFQTITLTMMPSKVTIPAGLILRVYAAAIGSGADVEIDRVEVFNTAIPILTTTVFGSYAQLVEQVDGVTGQVQFISENQQPVNGAMVLYDTFYALKGWAGTAPGSSMYSLQSSAELEPAQWNAPEVAQRLGGASGPLAFDLGEQWFMGATRAGAYVFVGGQPGKITQEIVQVWDSINWKFCHTIWALNDEDRRRAFFGVPMATPNFWLPNAPVNANPTSPNVILMCNYQGLDTGEAFKSEAQMHTTMFGTLNAVDMRRKWSIWQIPSPYGNLVQGATDQEIYLCNGNASSKVYMLDELAETDDGAIIDTLYTTAGLVEASKRATTPGIGNNRMRWGYMVATLQSLGNIAVRLMPNRLLGPNDDTSGYAFWNLPGGFSPGNPSWNDSEAPLNFAATRTYIEFRENDGHGFTLSNLVLKATRDVWNSVLGRK